MQKKFSGQSVKPETFFLLFANFIFLWLYFCISQPHLDSPGDMVENYAWGINWSWGNNKHPPLCSWITASWFYFFPTKDWSYYLLNSCNMLLTSIFLILGMQHVLDKNKAFIALALTIVVLPLSIDHGYKYNPNLAQLPFLTGYMWALIRAVNNQNKSNYIIAGLFAGAAMLCKYSAVLLLGPISLAVLIGLKPKPKPFAIGFLMTVIVACALFAPHVYWEVQHHWPSLNYMQTRSGVSGWSWFQLSFKDLPVILRFFSSPVVLLIVAVISIWPGTRILETTNPQPKIGLITFVLSLICIYAGAYIEGMKPDSSWLIVCTIFFGWALVDLLPAMPNLNSLSTRIKQLTLAYMLVATIGVSYFKVLHNEDLVSKEALPEIFAHDITAFYHDNYHQPIAFVGGSHPLAYDVTFYSSDHPIGFWGVDAKGSPWIDLNKFQSGNKIIVCGNERHFYPSTHECSEKALKVLGQPTQQKEFVYSALDVSKNLPKLVKYDVLIYSK